MTKQLCDEVIFFQAKPVSQCTHPAKYKYQLTKFHADYLCGVNARKFKGSPNLTPLTEKKQP